ncbi:hypothetical protein SAMN05428975_5922 [Mucilaginibacter sp. OK268]|uniref:hypothetical protein n=1 Tax=Mucilaginibacter sp. OK268 TaxID=1881048 RepID=UPI00088C44E2|nr:hypothetical protein [Mucilaginibacter sp. OK268]SDQ01667.1 hypothetical protein SAMN05428975_5922 [Mucilaginibacter sp. OK268]
MLKWWPFKKEYLLIAGAVILLLICYQLAFKNTITAWQFNRQLKTQLQQTGDISYQPGYLDRKSKNLEHILVLYRSDTALFRSNTISTIAVLAEKYRVKLAEVPAQDEVYHTERAIIQKLNFEGDFFALNSFLNQLESSESVGVVRAVEFKLQRKDAEPVSKKLMMGVYMEISR